MISGKKNNSQHSKSCVNVKRDQKNSQVIQKQLNDDFQVYQYLNENKLEGNNIDEYIRLHNSLLVTKTTKRKSLDNLGFNYRKLKAVNEADTKMKVTSDEDLLILKENFTRQYDRTQILTMNELEIKKNLWKEIIESKKSLILLKGDIGHLVGRNQSTSLLDSKISKVKIVADDQIKRVSMAFGKDKQQIKIRNQMQKNFSSKFKFICFNQQKNLENLKKCYIESVQKKKNLFQRLNEIQKISSSMDEYDGLNRKKNWKNFNSLQMFKSLQHIAALISSDPLKEIISFKTQICQHRILKSSALTNDCFKAIRSCLEVIQNDYDIFNEKAQYSSQHTAIVTLSKLLQIEEIIKNQFLRTHNQLSKTCRAYQQKIKNVKQLWLELEKYQMASHNQDGKESVTRWHSSVCKEERFTYLQIVKLLGNNIRTILKFLVYLQKNFPGLIKKNYASNLLTVYHQLLNIDIKSFQSFGQNAELQELQSLNAKNFKELNYDLSIWYHLYTNKKLIKMIDQKRRDQNRSITLKTSNHSSEDQKNYSGASSPGTNKIKIEQSDQKQGDNADQSIISIQRKAIHSIKSQKDQVKQKISSYYSGQMNDCGVKAQRIKLLQDIDKDYYKILKNTLKMQKENTRKNYEFLRSFKRAKYANRDEILDQKRFESSFSVLITSNDAKPKNSPKQSVHISKSKTSSRVKPMTASGLFPKRSVDSIRIKQSRLKQIKLSQKLKNILNQV